jgi:hypothetical protein
VQIRVIRGKGGVDFCHELHELTRKKTLVQICVIHGKEKED